MRKLVLLVCMGGIVSLLSASSLSGGVIPSWEAPSGKLGFSPVCNEVSFYKNYDDTGEDRGQTLQIVSINSFKLLTSFNFEFTGDFNWRYSYIDPLDYSQGKNKHDHYIELSLVKPLTPLVSLNVQRVLSTFEAEPVNQFGVRLSF